MGHSDPQATPDTHMPQTLNTLLWKPCVCCEREICHNSRTAAKAGSRKCLIEMVGTARFEPATSRTPITRAA